MLPSGRKAIAQGWVRIYRASPLAGKKLNSKTGMVEPYRAVNGAGYTLEAELGVSPNGYGEPDFKGWEVKAHGSNVVTLFTPEPDGGIYQSEGIVEFLSKYGYADKKGRKDRTNFGGIYRNELNTKITGLTLRMPGYLASTGMFDPAGSIALVDNSDVVAAEWSFKKLLKHWNRKHAKAVYVTYTRSEVHRSFMYSYHPKVHLGEGTDFRYLLASFADQSVYLDPAIKMENASTNPEIKRRNQFRINSINLRNLYKNWETVDLSALA
jgi:hypothetical protein